MKRLKMRKFGGELYYPFYDFDLRISDEDEQVATDEEIDHLAEFLEESGIKFRDALIFKWYRPFHRFYVWRKHIPKVQLLLARFNVRRVDGKTKHCVTAEYLRRKYKLKYGQLMGIGFGHSKSFHIRESRITVEREVNVVDEPKVEDYEEV